MAQKVKAGDILIAQPFMEDGNFKRSVIGITEHRNDGSVGFILNKPINIQLQELVQGVDSDENFSVYFGGPVASDTIHYMHNVGELLEDSTKIKNGLYWGGNFEKLIFLIQSGLIRKNNIRFYIGYSGWSEGQLENELSTGSWIVSEWFSNYTFQSKAKKLWEEALSHKGDKYSVIAQIPSKKNLN